jgi:hypothetical protein
MFIAVFGDIHIDDLQNLFPYAIMDITKSNEKNTRKTIHNKQFVEIRNLLKFIIL